MSLSGFPNSPIIIIGMHRSGTSLLTRILSDLEVFVGPKVSPNFEDVNFQQINRQLLASEGAHWANPGPFVSQLSDESFVKRKASMAQELLAGFVEPYQLIPQGQPWAWKDPRTTLTLPVWLSLFPEAKVIHLIRNGIEVALSLQRREIRRYFRITHDHRMFPPTIPHAYHLWQQYVEIGMSWRVLCNNWWQTHFFQFHANPSVQVQSLCQALAIPLPMPKLEQAVSQIRSTTPSSGLEKWWTQLLWNLKIIDHQPMLNLGYIEGPY